MLRRSSPVTSPHPSGSIALVPQRTSIIRSLSGPGWVSPARAMASPTPPRSENDAAICCCMCGDHGLARELFRCRSCRVRLQHSYCSNLYPRATAYKRCNWCLILREPPPTPTPAAHQGGGVVGAAGLRRNGWRPPTTNGTNNKHAAETTKRTKAASDEETLRQQQRRREGSSSSARRTPPELGCPVKKSNNNKRKAGKERTTSDAGVTTGSCTAPAGESSNYEMTRVRVKVRRYKLLAEVISC